jgi:hypothetical protein
VSRPDRDDRRVFLGMPGYGELTAGAARAFWRATRLPDRQVRYQYNEGSLLAANFNTLWAAALNLAHSGERVDYFAMQHADVEPEDWWLDALIDEMEARDLDVLGTVVPIKDRKGLTSLALGRDDGDTWRVLCRLTMAEAHALPETFTSEDCGHPLLLNTGLWVCRFSEEWARKVRFTINDRIVQMPDGRYVPQTEPEDWYFSRLCHELGMRIGATRKIKLAHRGGIAFHSDQVWGEPFDRSYVPESQIPDCLPLPEIDGWLRPEEARGLAILAKGRRVLEIGSYCGLSTVCLARTAASVVALDPHDGRGTPVPQNTLPALRRNLARYGVAGKVEVRVGVSGEPWPGDEFDVVYIDGDHSAEAVRRDIAHALACLAPGGLLAFHDYRSPHDPGVTEAVDELLAAGGELLSTHETLAVVRPPAAVPLEV